MTNEEVFTALMDAIGEAARASERFSKTVEINDGTPSVGERALVMAQVTRELAEAAGALGMKPRWT